MKYIIGFLKLIRWFHVLLVPLPFLGLYFVTDLYLEQYGIIKSYDLDILILLCVSIQLHVATGCVLNDLMDRKIDKINKPNTHIVGRIFSVKTSYLIFTILTVIIGILTVIIGLSGFKAWYFISPLIYVLSISYDTYFKRTPLMGNILMAVLTAAIPSSVYFYLIGDIQQIPNNSIDILFATYLVLPTLIIIPRELSLDISDMEGDRANGCKTLPILIGAKYSRYVVVLLLLGLIASSVPLMMIDTVYVIFGLIIDVLILIYIGLLYRTEKRIEYIRIGRFLWGIMIVGLIGITIISIP